MNKVEGIIMLSHLKLYYRAIIIKIVWYWNQNRYRKMEQDRDPRNKPLLI